MVHDPARLIQNVQSIILGFIALGVLLAWRNIWILICQVTGSLRRPQTLGLAGVCYSMHSLAGMAERKDPLLQIDSSFVMVCVHLLAKHELLLHD